MDDLIVRQNESELVNVLHNVGEEMEIPMPFERDIFLFKTEIAGTGYSENIDSLFESLDEGDLVVLIREPENPYDEYAIRIESKDNELLGYFPSEDFPYDYRAKLGYVPRVDNRVIARLMDAGKRIYGVVHHKEMVGTYHKIVVLIYLKE